MDYYEVGISRDQVSGKSRNIITDDPMRIIENHFEEFDLNTDTQVNDHFITFSIKKLKYGSVRITGEPKHIVDKED